MPEGQLDPRLIQGGRPNNDDRALIGHVRDTAIDIAKDAAKTAAEEGSAAAAQLARGFGALKTFFYYFDLVSEVLQKIADIGEQPYWDGYSEGYARVLARAAYGKAVADIPFRASERMAHVPDYSSVQTLETLQPRMNNPAEESLVVGMKKRGRGFFKGKADAIAALAKAQGGVLTEEAYLNSVYTQIAKECKIPPQLLVRLKPY